MTEDQTVQFPQYPTTPQPTGLQMAHPKQANPLYKIMRMMLKPRTRIRPPRQQRTKRWKKKARYY